jgi:hypothetical protein
MAETSVDSASIEQRDRKAELELRRARGLVIADLGKTWSFAFIAAGFLGPVFRKEAPDALGLVMLVGGIAFQGVLVVWPKVIK